MLQRERVFVYYLLAIYFAAFIKRRFTLLKTANAASSIQKKLFSLADKKYAQFQSSLVPCVSCEKIIGVRVPVLRRLAKELSVSDGARAFLETLPHRFYDENVLHAILISETNDFDACMRALDFFLPYVDNWAVSDSLSPKVFKTHKKPLIKKINAWILSEHAFTKRFAIVMLMKHFLESDFDEKYLLRAANTESENHYVKKAIAWFFATALTKRWNETLRFLENGNLKPAVHNEALKKARESLCLSKAQKAVLKTLMR